MLLKLNYAMNAEQLKNIAEYSEEYQISDLVERQILSGFIKNNHSKDYFEKTRETDLHATVFRYSTFVMHPNEFREIVEELKQVSLMLMRHYELHPIGNQQSHTLSQKIEEIVRKLSK